MIILNLKTYPEATGNNAYKIFTEISKFLDENPSEASKFTIAPSIIDIAYLRKTFPNVNLMSQTAALKDAGKTTGWPTAENLAEYGIIYSLLNHSENRVWTDSIVDDIKKIQTKDLKLVVCCQNLEEAEKLLEAEPFGIAYEPPELIDSDISVTTRPEIVSEFVKLVGDKTMTFIGAGIDTKEDIRSAYDLGAKGVLVASEFVKAEDKVGKLREFLGVVK